MSLLKTFITPSLAILIASLATPIAFTQRSNQGMGPLLDRAEIKPGEVIPGDLVIYKADGAPVNLAQITRGKYTVLVSGCLTCPIFHRSYPSVEAVYADYKGRDDIQFFFMYKSLAHPELNGYIQPMTLDERLAHIAEAKRVLGTTIEWLSDGTDNAVRHALGFGPNTQILIDPSGKVVHALGWSDGDVLREQIATHIGESDTHTTVADLNLKREQPFRNQRSYQQGVLEKPTFSSELAPVIVKPIESARSPLYVKPRIEVDQNVLREGKGELYLGFFLDPIHRVHWNNLADPLRYEFLLPDGTEISPAKATAPRVSQETDGDPREFALSVSSLGQDRTAKLTIHYYACSDEEGWCRPVTQTYAISFERDLDGGGTNGRSFRVNNPGGRGQGQRGTGGGVEQMRQRISSMDSNGDGKLSKEEAPENMRERFGDMDLDGDGQLDSEEIKQMLQRRNRQGGAGGRARGQAQAFDPSAIKERIMGSDADGDGLITREELPAQMQRRFEQMDANGDGAVDEAEVDAMLRNRPQGPPQRRPGGRPGGPGGGRNRI